MAGSDGLIDGQNSDPPRVNRVVGYVVKIVAVVLGPCIFYAEIEVGRVKSTWYC